MAWPNASSIVAGDRAVNGCDGADPAVETRRRIFDGRNFFNPRLTWRISTG
jgi:hypothetical protein